jgi:hypothetical protein
MTDEEAMTLIWTLKGDHCEKHENHTYKEVGFI